VDAVIASEAIHRAALEVGMDCFVPLAMTLMVRPHPLLSSSAHAEDPVRRGFSTQSLMSLEYWVTRLRG
jgi:hypothetical protein